MVSGDLVHRLRAWEPPKEVRPFRDALEQIAVAGGHPKPCDAANWMTRLILRHIEDKKSRKLRDWRLHKMYGPWVAKMSAPSRESAFHWVKMEQLRLENEQLPIDRHVSLKKIIERARALRNDNVNPIGKRAVELLLGARRKPSRKLDHPVETQANAIVERIKAEWYLPAQRGRPKNVILNTYFKESFVLDNDDQPITDENGDPYKVVEPHHVKLTHEEVVSIALPSILNLGHAERKLTAEIVDALSELVCKLDKDIARGSKFPIRDANEVSGFPVRDPYKVFDSVQEVAKGFLRRHGPPSKWEAESDHEEREHLKRIGL
jgi:hypothetical protein